jgi:hypothetical protein
LDVSFCGNAVTDEVVLFLAKSAKDLERLSIRGCIQVTDKGLQGLVENAHRLMALNATNCKNITPAALKSVPSHWKMLSAQDPTIECTSIAGGDVYGSGHFRRYTA